MFGIMQQPLCKKSYEISSHQFNYCGTCKSIGSTYGHKSRIFLNYDIVFLSALLNNLKGENTFSTAYSNKSCWAMPSMESIPLVFKYTSALNIYLAGIKIKDNILDEKFPKNLHWKFSKLVYAKNIKSAVKNLSNLSFPIEKVERLILNNFQLENEKNLSIETYSKPTSEITKIAFNHGSTLMNLAPQERNIIGKIGSSLGKIVYLNDVLQDYNKDQINKSFNPILSSDQVTFAHVKSYMLKQIDKLIVLFETLNISNSLKSRYLLPLASLKSNKKRNNRRNGSSLWCFEICNNDECYSSCCHCECEGCCDCGCD